MDYEETLEMLKARGQEQLLDYYGELDDDGRERLLRSIEGTDFSVLDMVAEGKRPLGRLSPVGAVDVKKAPDAGETRKRGLGMLSRGEAGAVCLAGGMGTRLGCAGPKGAYDLGLTREATLFGLQMRTVLSRAEECGAAFPLFVMTSDRTDAETREFFASHRFFGYGEENVRFFVQGNAPAVSHDGKMLLEEKDRVFLSPDGNGGWYSSLVRSGLMDELSRRGVRWLNVFSVDNPLQNICDPYMLGAAEAGGYSCAAKVVSKVSPDEGVGVLCTEDGRPSIVEYYEMPAELKSLRGDDGELVYRYGVILNYLFRADRLDAVSAVPLPVHMADKKVPHMEGGRKVYPESPNAYKFETLAVDLVRLMDDCLAVEADRDTEFAPVKNLTGADSVESARERLAAAGVEL